MTSELAQPVTTHRRTGWIRVDEEIAELRRHFQAATTPQDLAGKPNGRRAAATAHLYPDNAG